MSDAKKKAESFLNPEFSPVVFVGPSLSPAEAQRRCPQARILPPIARDDLYAARAKGIKFFLIIDGVFAHRLAIPPSEVVDVIKDGAVVLGASSMGAIRSAECWPVGMRGIGCVYQLFRDGIIESDDEVAVTMDPDNEFTALSVALVNVRYAVKELQSRQLVDQERAGLILTVAQGIFFSERQWSHILRHAGINDSKDQIKKVCQGIDVKRSDAILALNQFSRLIASDEPSHQPQSEHLFLRRTPRYLGHDRFFGIEPSELKFHLLKWLFGSGRYQRYLLGLVVDADEFIKPLKSNQNRSEVIRDRLATILSKLLDNPISFAERAFEELEFLEELDTELIYWYAVWRLAQIRNAAPSKNINDMPMTSTREQIAIAHGYRGWAELTDDIHNGQIFGAIPFDWIQRACEAIALARSIST